MGVGELYCESSIFENMNHRDHIPDTVYVDRRPAPSQHSTAPPPLQHSAIFTSAPRQDISGSLKTPTPAVSHFSGANSSDLAHHSNHSHSSNHNVNVVVPTDREHCSWNEFQALNKGVSRERIQEVWKTTPWYATAPFLQCIIVTFVQVQNPRSQQIRGHQRQGPRELERLSENSKGERQRGAFDRLSHATSTTACSWLNFAGNSKSLVRIHSRSLHN